MIPLFYEWDDRLCCESADRLIQLFAQLRFGLRIDKGMLERGFITAAKIINRKTEVRLQSFIFLIQ